MYVATLSILSFVFLIQTLFLSIRTNFKNLASSLGQSDHIVLYLKEDVSEETITLVRSRLQSMNFSEIKFFSKEDASIQFGEQMKNYLPDLANDPHFKNPFPASFDLQVASLANIPIDRELLGSISKELMQIEGASDVSYGGDWIKNYRVFLSFISSSGLFMTLLLFAAGLFVVGFSIQSSVHHRREEIEILELVGATNGMIRFPFVFEGALTGLISSLIALGLGYGVFRWFQELAQDQLTFWALSAKTIYLSPQSAFTIIISGVLLGAFGSLLCVWRINTGWAAASQQQGY